MTAPSIRNRIVRHGEESPDQLLANPWNFRRHPGEQLNALRGSMKELGWIKDVIVNVTTGHVLDGHARIEESLRQGITSIPVTYVELSEDEERLALAVLDPISELAYRDDDAVAELLRSITTDDPGLRQLLTSMAVEAKVDGLGSNVQVGANPAVVPDAPAVVVTKAGDLIQLGRHWLLCGDSRNSVDVDRLIGDRLINLAFTSPPYAEQRAYDEASSFRPVPPEEYVEWFAPVSDNVRRHLAPDGSWFINIKAAADQLDTSLYVMDLVIAHVRQWGWHFATEYCWERNGVPKSVTRRFKNQFEPIYQFSRGDWKMRPEHVRHESENVPTAGGKGSGPTTWGAAQGGKGKVSVSGSFGAAKKGGLRKRPNGIPSGGEGDDTNGTNWQPGEYIGPGMAYPGNRLPTFTSSHEALGHSAAFPIGLPEFFIKAYTDLGDVVYDPFAGSGSTLMAAEITGRSSCNIEISPAYCDVICGRFERATGIAPIRP